MKKLLLCFSLSFSLYFIGNAQQNIAIGIEGSIRYTLRSEPNLDALDANDYMGLPAFDGGISFSKAIENSRFWWHTGIYKAQFKENIDWNVNLAIDSSSLENPFEDEYDLQTNAFQVPVGVKIFFSDRKCMMFVHPAIEFGYFYRKKTSNQVAFEQLLEESDRSPQIPDFNSFQIGASMAIGGQLPITKTTDIMIQMRTTVSLWDSRDIGDQRWMSLGLRVGVLQYL